MRARLLTLTFVLASLASGACVSKSKHEATLKKLAACETERDNQKGQITDLTDQLGTMTKDRDDQKTRGDAASQALADLQEKMGIERSTMEADLEKQRVELEELRKQRAEAEKRLAAFKKLTEKFQKMIDAGRLKVTFRKGRMIVELPAGVLFESGKAKLSDDGEKALSDVASILKEFPDRSFLVAGHTDNVPIKDKHFKSNWELSTARAVTVTQYLIDEGVPPQSLSAAGYAQFDPIGDNDTEEGRAQNRRIEIIMMPNIEELPTLDDSASGS